MFMQDLPKLGPDLSSGTSHTISVHVFLNLSAKIPKTPTPYIQTKGRGDTH